MSVPHHRLVSTFSAFAWNADKSMLAVCPNSTEVWVYTGCHADPSEWVKQYVLKQHDLLVSGVDWHPVTNKIVTCSHDRNAFVWQYDAATDSWQPTVAMLRINRAALDVKWAPDGTKFAVATGTKSVCLCTYEEANNWWVATHIKEHRSTVLSVNWHPNSQLIITGCCDFKARIMSTTLRHEKPNAGPFSAPQPQGKAYVEYGAGGWVEDAVWSPSGNKVAFTAHDCTVTFVDFTRGGQAWTIHHKDLPYTRLLFLSERTVVAVGHGRNPTLYTADASTGAWSLLMTLDRGDKTSTKSLSSFGTAREMFVAKTRLGESPSATSDTLSTIHQGAITHLAACGEAPVTCFSTAGIDGILALWNLSELDVDFSAAGLA